MTTATKTLTFTTLTAKQRKALAGEEVLWGGDHRMKIVRVTAKAVTIKQHHMGRMAKDYRMTFEEMGTDLTFEIHRNDLTEQAERELFDA